MNGLFSGKTALVIGGSGGIGAAISVKLAKMGAFVHVHGGSSQQRLDRTLAAIEQNGGKGSGFLYSINGPEAVGPLLAHVPEPDILVCAWGPFSRQSLPDTDAEIWNKMIKTNLIFPGFLISSSLGVMIKKGWGRILLFGGTNTDTIRGFVTTTAYSAAKTALGSLAKSVAKTAGSAGVTCNVICPGLTDTEYIDEAGRLYNQKMSPNGKALSPENIAEAAILVLGNPYINGALIPVDNGLFL